MMISRNRIKQSHFCWPGSRLLTSRSRIQLWLHPKKLCLNYTHHWIEYVKCVHCAVPIVYVQCTESLFLESMAGSAPLCCCLFLSNYSWWRASVLIKLLHFTQAWLTRERKSLGLRRKDREMFLYIPIK